MGDVSIIARRLKDGHVQYGWSGNGGYFRNVGFRLHLWYSKPEDVEYLFGLGQTAQIGKKGSENGGMPWYETHELRNEAFWLGQTERTIFSKIVFIDYGYFYDLDEEWYYIIPGPFRIKIPFWVVEAHLDENDYEFTFRREIDDKIMRYILMDYPKKDEGFRNLLKEKNLTAEAIMENIMEDDMLSMYHFFDAYHSIFSYFDDWILVKSSMEERDKIAEIVVKKKTEDHIETCEW